MFKSKLLLISFSLIITESNGQSLCHSVLDTARALQIQPNLINITRNYAGINPIIRLALHRITKGDGTGGFTWDEINGWVNTLPDAYSPFNICFTTVSTDDIQNDDDFNLTSFGCTGCTWQTLIGTNTITNAINVYFVSDADQGGVSSGFLFPTVTANPTVTVSRTVSSINLLNTFVLAHEIGHTLGLLHTFETAICTENIPRTGTDANCTTCGDLLCDTPADPGLGISTSNVNDATCAYIGGLTRGGFDYAPDTHNIMSYTLPHCMENFTAGQGDRMLNFIENTTSVDAVVVPFNETVTGTFTGDAYFSVENVLTGSTSDIIPLQISSGTITFQAGQSVLLQPGFAAWAGSNFTAEIGSYACNSPLQDNSGKRTLATTIVSPTNSNITIFPNPFSNNIKIDFNVDNDQTPVTVIITDILGKLVYQKSGSYASGDQELSVWVNSSASVFIAKVYVGGQWTVQKLVKVCN